MCTRHKQRGISLIELIIFIVIVSVALAGILRVMNVTSKGSADPLIHKQSLAIAEALLEEVELMPFTFCDPNDVNAATAVNAAGCSAGMDQNKGGAALMSPTPASETRYSTSDPFDNVADYGGCQMNTGTINGCDSTGTSGIRDINNNPIGPAVGYSASVALSRVGIALLGGADDGAALRITVTVTGSDGLPVVMEGVRTRYAPRTMP
jgi:MSHA pilin protein MshD